MTDAELVALGEATVDQIVDELERRYDTVLLVYEGPKPGDAGVERMMVATAGGLSAAIGLCVRAQPLLVSRSKDVNEDDDEE